MRSTCPGVLAALFLVSSAGAGDFGTIEGRVTDAGGQPVAGVGVRINETAATTSTETDGSYSFRRVPAGVYSLTFFLGRNETTRSEVPVTPGLPTEIDQSLDWEIGIVETVTVTAVSRRREGIIEAPGAVTRLGPLDIQPAAPVGQAPKLLEFTPGVSITQYSDGGFFLDTRGFNGNLTRRVGVLQDGRDLTDPFIGAMDWWIVANPLDDLAGLELVRGPSSALYGANATGGVVHMTTKAPRDSQGGMVRLAAGQRNTTNADFRWAGDLGRDWYVKVLAGTRRSDGFQRSRLNEVEYSTPCSGPPNLECLPLDGIPLPEADIRTTSGALRFDRYFGATSVITIEGGTTEFAGPVFINSGGRGQINDVERPWARFNFSNDHWNVLGYYSERDILATNLTSGNPFLLDAHNSKIEVQTNWSLLDNRVHLVGGASYYEENLDSNILPSPGTTEEEAVYAQVDWEVNSHLKLVGAARWDDSTLHDSRLSPKASLLYSFNPEHSLRLTYNEAFQVPTYPEFFLIFPLAFTTDLDPLNQICLQAPYNIDCELGETTNYIYGNSALQVEEVTTFELGYKGVLANKAWLTLDLYDSENVRFVTLAPQLMGGVPTNPDLLAWVGPDAAEATPIAAGDCPTPGFAGGTIADCVRAEAAELLAAGGTGSQLTNLPSSAAAIALLTNTNFGTVDTQGVELGFRYFFDRAWNLSLSHSWFDFEVREVGAGANPNLLVPNAPEHRSSLGLSYAAGRWNGVLSGRWVDEFFWFNGTHGGTVDAFTTFDLNGSYAVSENWTVGLNVSNLFDDEHPEAWGGDLITRRALATVTFYW